MIDESKQIYRDFKATYKTQAMEWVFPSGAKISFNAIGSDDDLGGWQGSQLVRALIDEAGDSWTEKQVLFLLSRLRSGHSKIHPQLIMTCNPDKNSFLKEWVDFCLDPDSGVPVEGTENRIRWMVVLESKVLWADSAEECFELHGKPRGMINGYGLSREETLKIPVELLFIPKSFRFVPTGVFDNPHLLPPKNTSYLAGLLAQPKVNQLKFLHGSWTAQVENANMFNREWCEIVDRPPINPVSKCRSWDLASTVPSEANRNPDWTAGVLMSRDKFGYYYIEDVHRFRKLPDAVLQEIIKTARLDGDETQVTIPKDSGAGAAAAAMYQLRTLAENGVPAKTVKISGHSGKTQRFLPLATLAESGSLRIVKGDWNEAFLSELENFDGSRNIKDD